MKQLFLDIRNKILSLSDGNYQYAIEPHLTTPQYAGDLGGIVFSGTYTGALINDTFRVTLTDNATKFSWSSAHGSGSGITVPNPAAPYLMCDGISVIVPPFGLKQDDYWLYKITSQPMIKFCQMWNNQLAHVEEGDHYSFAMPAIFVEFISPAEIQQLGNGNQIFDPLFVRLHIVHEFLNATDGNGTMEQDLTIFDLREAIYMLINKFEPDGAVAFVRSAESQDYDHPNIYHYMQEYRTNYMDVLRNEPLGGIIKQPVTNYLKQDMFENAQTDYCSGDGAVDLTNAAVVPGGVYQGPGILLFQGAYYFDPGSAGVGSYTITYTLNGQDWTVVFTVHPLPTVTLAPFANVHVNAAPFTLSGGSPAGGYYACQDVPGAVTNNVFDPSVAGIGTHTINYTYQNTIGCASFAQQPINVIP